MNLHNSTPLPDLIKPASLRESSDPNLWKQISKNLHHAGSQTESMISCGWSFCSSILQLSSATDAQVISSLGVLKVHMGRWQGIQSLPSRKEGKEEAIIIVIY